MATKRNTGMLFSRIARPFIEEPAEPDELNEVKQRSPILQAIVLLAVLSASGFAISLFEALAFSLSTAIVSAALWSVAICFLVIVRPRTGLLALSALYIGIVAIQVVSICQITSTTPPKVTAWDTVGAAVAAIALSIVLRMPLRDPSLSRAGISQPYSIPSKKFRSPEDNLTLWQWMTVSWMSALITIGSKRQLNDEDVWFLGYEFQHTHLHEAFRALSGTVVRRLIKANWIDLVILTLLAILELVASLSAPVILQRLLQAMDYVDVRKRPAIIYAALILTVRLVAAQSGVISLWFARRSYERSRGEMVTMLHEKVLHRKIIGGKPQAQEKDETEGTHGKSPNGHAPGDDQQATEAHGLLSGKVKTRRTFWRSCSAMVSNFGSYFRPGKEMTKTEEKQPASMGKILNLMRNDVYETAQRFWEFQDLVNKPLGLILSTILVWRLIGWSCFVGIAVVLVAQVVNALCARMLLKWEKVRRKATDQKLQQITQYIEAIRHLRWYGWHLKMLENVMSARQKELNIRIITFFWNSTIVFVNQLANGILPVAAFWAYTTIEGRRLRIDIAFPALQLFSILQSNLRQIPNLITVLLNAAVAVGRIEEFMSEPEVAEVDTTQFAERLELRKASFAWPGVRETVLDNLDVSFDPGLTVIIGPVASGKTALLQALLGELDLRNGDLVRPDTPVAYCAQTPWLQSMNIRENILFGSLYDGTRYKEVLEACALLPDLASFKQGDLSPIGENGIGLSGGQKARVALARALYSTAKYILLDDPLSALDQQTAEWIVSKCFGGDLLNGRTTILVTHRTDLCQNLSQQTVELSHGSARTYIGSTKGTSDQLEVNRINSLTKDKQDAQESAAVPEKFEDEEHREHGGVRFKVYWEYIKAGKLKWWTLLILACVLWRLFDYSQSWFLKEWGEAYDTASTQLFLILENSNYSFRAQSSPLGRLFERFPDPAINVNPWLLGFLVLVVLQTVSFLLSQILMLFITYSAGKGMFRDVMKCISNATFHFYDVTPVGRLMNRLTSDVGTVDGAISYIFLEVSWQTITWVASVVVIASITPLFLMFSVALTACFIYVFLRFLPTSQSLRRLEMVSLSPLMSNFGALLNGLMTVRAFHVQSQFQARVIQVTDAFQGMDHFYWSLQAWLMYRFDTLSATSTFILTLLAIYSGLTSGLTAFVLIAAHRFVYSTHALCKAYGKLQLDFVSVERVVELLHLEQEAPGTIIPPANWPSSSGAIVLEDVTVRYAPHLDPALKNITLTIPGGTNTAIVGRTGSGKSTLALGLIATILPESGRILLDGIDISHVSKQILRTRVTFLAQDPILFPGTLRSNLDPLFQHSEDETASVLARIGGEKYDWTLSTSVDVGGKNLSQGQRQLVGLARAILRRSSVIIMDEATASIDLETSLEVQRVLREELRGSTVVTIAHRAGAVEGCDWVCTLDKGELISFEGTGSNDRTQT